MCTTLMFKSLCPVIMIVVVFYDRYFIRESGIDVSAMLPRMVRCPVSFISGQQNCGQVYNLSSAGRGLFCSC